MNNPLNELKPFLKQSDVYLQMTYFPICALFIMYKGLFSIVGSICLLVCVEYLKRSTRQLRPNKYDTKSFPSGHAAVAWYIAGLYGFNPIITLWALCVSASRVYNQHHYVQDVCFGAVIGIIGGTFVRLF
jgi:hypothetical protein